jgi:hypothetical protein
VGHQGFNQLDGMGSGELLHGAKVRLTAVPWHLNTWQTKKEAPAVAEASLTNN